MHDSNIERNTTNSAGAVNTVNFTSRADKDGEQTVSTGVKHDKGKAQLSTVSYESVSGEARAMEYGLHKYGRNNYKGGMDWSRLIDAALRHIYQFSSKQDIDDESKLNHLYHAKASLGMLIYYYENKLGKDDR